MSNRKSLRRLMVIVMIAVACAFLALFVAPLLFVREGTDDYSVFKADLQDTYRRVYYGYVQPISEATGQLVTPCRDVAPGSASPGCAHLVDVMADDDAVVLDSIDRLNSTIAHAPSGLPASNRSSIENLIGSLERIRDSNQLIVEGWRTTDQAKWDKGWSLNSSLSGLGSPTVRP